MQGENVTSSSLLLAHAHFAFLFKEFLSANSVLSMSPNNTSVGGGGVAASLRKQRRRQSSSDINNLLGSSSDLEANESGIRDRVVSLDEDEGEEESAAAERTRLQRELSIESSTTLRSA